MKPLFVNLKELYFYKKWWTIRENLEGIDFQSKLEMTLLFFSLVTLDKLIFKTSACTTVFFITSLKFLGC